MDKKYNVLIIHNKYRISGGEDTVVANETKLLQENGHKTIILEANNENLSELPLRKKILFPIAAIYNTKYYRTVRKIIRDEKIDIVHAHNTFPMISPSIYYAACKEKVPVVQTVHNYRMMCPNALFLRDGHICEDCLEHGLRTAVKNRCYHGSKVQTWLCTKILEYHRRRGIYKKINYICLTDFGKELFQKHMGKYIDPARLYVKPNYVADEVEALNVEPPLISDQPYFLYAGRLSEEKGVLQLAEAWNREEMLLICGSGPLRERLEKLITEQQKNIQLLGNKTHHELMNLMYYAQALFFPSVWYETFGMTIAESMMSGTPVIANDIGNGATMVREVAPEYVIDISKELDQLLDRYRKQEYADAFRKYYEQHFTEQANYSILMTIYQSVMSNNEKR